MSQPQNAMQFKQLDAELWLLDRLQRHLAQIFDGDTDPDVRKERVRRAILAAELSCIVLGKGKDGKSENYEKAFERLYGEPLTPTKRKGKSA